VRTAWYIIWAGVFVALSLASLSTEIAPTQPEFLPYAGLVCAAFLVILSFATIIGSIRRVKRIEIDSRTRTIRGMRGGRERWRYSADQLSEVYATLVLTKVTRRKRVQHMHHGEINLHKRDGAFHHVITQGQTDEKVPSPVGVALDAVNAEFVVPQTPQNAFTRLQAATLLIAQALQLPSQYDQRIK
jgi:hypothetical protein